MVTTKSCKIFIINFRVCKRLTNNLLLEVYIYINLECEVSLFLVSSCLTDVGKVVYWIHKPCLGERDRGGNWLGVVLFIACLILMSFISEPSQSRPHKIYSFQPLPRIWMNTSNRHLLFSIQDWKWNCKWRKG